MRQDAIVCFQNAARAKPENAVAYGECRCLLWLEYGKYD